MMWLKRRKQQLHLFRFQDDGKDEELGKAVMPYDEVAQGEVLWLRDEPEGWIDVLLVGGGLFLCEVFRSGFFLMGPILGGSNLMQINGDFEGFPKNHSVLFGLVIHHDPCFRKWGSIVSLNHTMHWVWKWWVWGISDGIFKYQWWCL